MATKKHPTGGEVSLLEAVADRSEAGVLVEIETPRVNDLFRVSQGDTEDMEAPGSDGERG